MSELDLDHKDCTTTSSDNLMRMMRVRYAPPEYALFQEVYATTGFGANRRTDAVAVGLFPSRGLLVHGFELKVSRADWLRELKDHGKAEEVFQYCDHWWLVAGNRNIVKEGELPPTWGLIAPRGDSLATVFQAPKLKPKPITREFFASLARRSCEMATGSINDRVDAATEDMRKRVTEAQQQRDEARRLVNMHLAEQVAAFEKASGISITERWQGPERIGEIVKAILEHGLDRQRHAAEYALESITRVRKSLTELLKVLPEKKKTDG